VDFITPSGQALERWKLAFPDLSVWASVEGFLAGRSAGVEGVCWFDISGFSTVEARQALAGLVSSGVQVVTLSSMPDDAEAFSMLSQGARGYCHVESSPQQLREVATVVVAGGYWMPPGLVRRLTATTTAVASTLEDAQTVTFTELTEREQQVATEIGLGASNREIAEKLGVSERTVKAHLTSIFDKLGLRDRVQLALAVTGRNRP